MKINYLKINGFGKLKNKEIKLDKNINLIYGKNESGKTSLLKFISGMFYGISKNKNGKDISDFEKYLPWSGEDFSGKLIYGLDNEENFEIYRDFKKKAPKIYNNKLKDISNSFNIDKNLGNEFFYEQTMIDENLFYRTTLVEQQCVSLDTTQQNILTQKITNLLSSGENNISYKKSLERLNKRLIEEVGNDRTIGRPLNNILEKINNINNEKNNIENLITKNNEINLIKTNLKNKLEEKEIKINLIKKIKKSKSEINIEEEKIKINNNLLENYNKEINKLNNKLELINSEKNKKIITPSLIFLTVLIVLNIFIGIINLNDIIEYGLIIFTLIYIFFNLFILIKNKFKKSNNLNILKLKNEIEININNRNKLILEINKNNNLLNIKIKNNYELIFDEYKEKINREEINILLNTNLNKLIDELEILENDFSKDTLELNTILIEEKHFNEQLDRKASLEEELQYFEEQKNEILSLEKSIVLARKALEDAYIAMKNNFTPKFTKTLSILASNISNGKYSNVTFNDENGLMVELENGEYINCNRLSLGTIDQLYLSLRISVMLEISKESMPIILDEAFAYFDTSRLQNILKYLNENYKNNQIIIFSCSNREKEILDKLNIEYNFIEL